MTSEIERVKQEKEKKERKVILTVLISMQIFQQLLVATFLQETEKW